MRALRARTLRRLLTELAVAHLACGLLAAMPPVPQVAAAEAAAILVVTSAANRGAGTLRDALERANVDGAPTTIRFAIGGDLQLDEILPAIADAAYPTTIDGSSAPSRVRIRGSAANRGSALLVASRGNVFRSIDFHAVDFDVVNLLESADDNLFDDVAITSCRRGIGLVLLGADGNRFERMRIESNAAAGIYARDGSNQNTFGPGLRVANNASGGIVLRACYDNLIAGTPSAPVEFVQNAVVGIGLNGGSSRNILGPALVITGGTGNGVRVSDPLTMGNVVQDVLVSGVSGHSFSIGLGTHHNLLLRCTADGQSLSGILMESRASENAAYDCVVLGRAGSASGLIALSDSPRNDLVRCTVVGRGSLGSTLNPYGLNLVRSPGTEVIDCGFSNLQNYGLAIAAGSDGCFVYRCTVSSSGGAPAALGILVQGAAGAPLRGAAVVDCSFLDCRDAGASVQYAQDVLFEGNLVRAAANTGLRIGTGSERTIVSANLLDGVGATGIGLESARDVSLLRNTIRGFGNGIYAVPHLGQLVVDANHLVGHRQTGLVLGGVPATVTNNLFDSNDIGVGTQNAVLTGTRLVNNTYVHNRVGQSGGAEIWNCIFWFNTLDLTQASLSNGNLQSNVLQAGNLRIGSQGNISSAPVFVDPTARTGNFHLRNVASPLLDGGSTAAPGLPGTDLDGEARIQGPRPDIGMDEVR